MPPEDWQEIWALFEEASALPESERHCFLKAASKGNDDLRRGVERLLEADEKAGTLLDGPLLGRAGRTPRDSSNFVVNPTAVGSGQDSDGEAAEAARIPHRRLGPYRLLRRVGQGGMSTVYLAERDDETFRRQQVIKLVRQGLETETMLRRLRTERQILASLEHPFIARLYDGGTTDEGLPYFALEYVDGLPITDYARAHELSLSQRLDLFQDLCGAVSYAHQKLVIHRDLKPSNILVTEDGVPKLLDFGIAKLLEPEGMEGGEKATATWQRALTPSHASPEQIRGDLVSTASDVYSLGVLLYELLSGALPYDASGRTPAELEKLLTETEPVPPSQARGESSLEPLQPAVQGDLDAIVLKALRSKPEERYSSVESLVADIERYREGLPVLARRGSWRYRAGKFLRRNRRPVAAAAGLGLLLLGFSAAALWQAHRVARERDQVRLERDEKEAIAALLLEVFAKANPERRGGAEVTVLQAILDAVPTLDASLLNQPEQRAAYLLEAGKALAAHDRLNPAIELVEESLRLRREAHGEAHEDVAMAQAALSAIYRKRSGAATPKRSIEAAKEDLDLAEELARNALATLRELFGEEDPRTVAPLNEVVATLCYREHYEAARPLAAEALKLARHLPEGSLHFVVASDARGVVHKSLGEYREAAELFAESLEAQRTLWGKNDFRQWKTLNNLALSRRRLGESASAVEGFEEVLRLFDLHLEAGHSERAKVLNNLGGARGAGGDLPGARSAYEGALEILHRADEVQAFPVLLVTLRLAEVRIRLGEGAAVEEELRPALEGARQDFGEGSWIVAFGESTLGEALRAQRRWSEAEPLLAGSFLRLAELGAKKRYQEDAYHRLRRLLEELGRGGEVAGFRALLQRSSP